MKIACWDIQGLNDPVKQKEIAKIINSRNLHIMGIVKTKVTLRNFENIFANALPSWESIHNTTNNRIWFCWDPHGVQISKIRTARQAITCWIHSTIWNIDFDLAFLYGTTDLES